MIYHNPECIYHYYLDQYDTLLIDAQLLQNSYCDSTLEEYLIENNFYCDCIDNQSRQ